MRDVFNVHTVRDIFFRKRFWHIWAEETNHMGHIRLSNMKTGDTMLLTLETLENEKFPEAFIDFAA